MGITVQRGVFKITTRQIARCLTRATGGRSIFNPDKRRLQTPMRRDDAIIKHVLDIPRLDEHHTFGGAVLLHSKAGCTEQPFHTDYDPQVVSNAKIKPFGVICALEDDTKFVTPTHMYTLSKGDVLRFDGDEVHAGAAYAVPNTRIHVYVDVCDQKRLRNKTWIVTSELDP